MKKGQEMVLINNTPLLADTVDSLVTRINTAIVEGRLTGEDVLAIRLRVKFMEDFAKTLKDSKVFAEKSVETARQFENVPFQYGFIPKVSQKTTYKYDHCLLWKKAKAELTRIESAMKQLCKSEAMMVSHDGEVVVPVDQKTNMEIQPAIENLSNEFIRWESGKE